MRREFFIQVSFLLLINLLIKPFYIFGIDRSIQNVVGTVDYGLYFAAFNFTYLFQIINDFGLQTYNNGQVAGSGSISGTYLANIIRIKFVLGAAYLLVVFGAILLLGYPADQYHWILLIAGNHLLNSWVLFFRSGISGMGLYFRDSLLSVLDKFLLILICAFLLWFDFGQGPFRMIWLILAQGLSLLLTGMVAGVQVFRLSGKLTAPFDFSGIRRMFWESLPYALVVFLMTAYTRMDAVMLERILPEGPRQAGVYASAFRLLDAVNMLGFLFAGLLLPMFSRLIVAGKSVEALSGSAFRVLMGGALVLPVAVTAFREEIMSALYTAGDAYAAEVLAALIWSFPFFCGSYIYGTLLTAGRHLRSMNLVFVAGLLINFVLNFIFIPRYQAAGAAWATALTQFAMFVAQYLLAHRLFGLRYDTGVWLRLLISIVILYGIVELILPELAILWYLRFFLTLGIGLILTFATGLIKVGFLAEMLKSRQQSAS